MSKFVPIALSGAALFALSGCGSSESANEAAQAENVEMPAEEAVGDVVATPVADPSANAVDAAAAMDAPAEEPAKAE
ncbi:hypothetical protein B0I00_2468 [Novosphingobium kunmingense]|uniref:Lipoprotein n=1 Tax=Novosphingobium kunmingense TaxID=1211806 RepID=A0A2N0H7E5_9SPHN|nr:hypothetical protein [Novosphingobium kunmingense]PKB14866.1 hypothetical protein B0I00_2468 [Novosphingobium kunmingense]